MQILDIHPRDSFTPLCLETCTKIFKRHFFLATEKKKEEKKINTNIHQQEI